MSSLIILLAVFTLSWLPILNVNAGKLNTEDIETANSILQRLHKLQEKTVLNNRIKKQRLEEVNNHNERVKFLHKLSHGAHELYSPEEKKDVNDLLHKLKIVDINDKIINSDNNVIVLQKALALLQGVNDNKNDNKALGLTLLQDNEDIHRSKPTLPTLRDLENSQALSQIQNKKKVMPSSPWTEKTIKNKDIPFLPDKNIDGKAVPLSVWEQNRSNKPLLQILSSAEHISVLSRNENGDVNNQKAIQRYHESDKEQDNVLEQVLKLLQQQQNNNKNRISSISSKSKNKGYYDGFLGDLNLKNLLNKLQKESEVKEPQNNYFQGSSYEETEENKNHIVKPDDQLDGYSKVFVVLDPEAINSENNRYEANKVISELTTWAAKLNKYWEPKQRHNKKISPNNGFRRRRPEYFNENEDRRSHRYERPGVDDNTPIKYRSNYRYRAQRGGGGISRTAAPFVHPRGDIYEKILD